MKSSLPLSLRLSLVGLMLFYALYAGLMVWDSSNVIGGMRYFCLLDDPMISMRYARNLADGLGLVWNAGERVEGITNPGWTFIMALVHLIEHNRAHTSLYIQVLGAMGIMGSGWLGARLAWRLSGGSAGVAFITAALSLFYFPVNYWGLFGMETSILGLMIMASTLLAMQAKDRGRFPWECYLILGLATIVRIDAAVPLVLTAAWCAWSAQGQRERLRHGVALALTLAVFVGGQTLARLWYYGLPFPNTYYLKMTGFPAHLRIARGAFVTGRSLLLLLWPALVIAGLALLWKTWREKSLGWLKTACTPARCPFSSPPDAALPIMLILGQVAYSVYVGGDAWEDAIYLNRFMIVILPMIAVIAIWRLSYLNSVFPLTSSLYRKISIGLFAIISVIYVNSNAAEPLTKSEIYLMVPETLQKKVSNQLIVFAKLLNPIKGNPTVASDWAGTLPYFYNGYVIDPLGKCDPYISRLPSLRSHWIGDPWNAFWPGHMKWDSNHTFVQQKPEFAVLGFLPFADASRNDRENTYHHVNFDILRLQLLQRNDFKEIPPFNTTIQQSEL